jgi:integrase
MAGSIRATDDGFVADITIQGKRRTRRCRSLAEAQDWLKEARGSDPGICSFTIVQARDQSLRVRWAGTSYERTAAIYSQAVVDFFGPGCLVSEVTAPKVAAWREALLRGGNRPATVNRKVSALRAMLTDAVIYGHLAAVPTLPPQLRAQNSRDRVISDDERRGMAAAMVQMGQPAAADMLDFLLETGARFGEVSKLRAKDVDLTRRRVTFWETKSGRPRTVPLTTRATEALSRNMPPVPDGRVWPYDYTRFSWLFQKAKDACGLGGDPGVTIHTCRHTCATKLASSGISLHQLMAWGGWTSLASVQRYLHLHVDALGGCVQALEG